MRPKLTFAASLIAISLAYVGSAFGQDEKLSFTPGELPTKQVQPNSVYGSVRFNLEAMKGSKKINDSLFNVLMNGFKSILKEEGKYILAIEVMNASNDVLQRRAIVEAERKSEGWFIFSHVEKTSEQTEWYGDVISNLLIDPDRNDVRVRVKSFYSESSQLDLQTFNAIVDIISKSKVLGAVSPAAEGAWKSIAEPLEKIIKSYKQVEIADIATVSFAKFNQAPNPKGGVFFRKYKIVDGEGVTQNYSVKLQVRTELNSSRVALIEDGKVKDPFHANVLAAARVGDQTIISVLGNSKNDAVKKFMADLNSSNGYGGNDVGDRCEELFSNLSDYFTISDKVIVYWAILTLYDRKLKKNENAKDCLSKYATQMQKLGLPTNEFAFAVGLPTPTAQIPPGSTSGIKAVASEKADVKEIISQGDKRQETRTVPSFSAISTN